MTVVIYAANERYSVVVSDRLLSSPGGSSVGEATKCAFVICPDAVFVMGYTGLAKAGRFHTRRWIYETLTECARGDARWEPLVTCLATKATQRFTELDDPDKRLSIVFAGYSYESDGARPYCLMVSNYDDLRDTPPLAAAGATFRFTSCRSVRGNLTEPYSLVLGIGAESSLPDEFEESLAALVRGEWRGEWTPEQIRDTAVSFIRRAANEDCAVGRDCLSVILAAHPSQPPRVEYHPVRGTGVMYHPDVVDLSDEVRMISMDDELWLGDTPPWWEDASE